MALPEGAADKHRKWYHQRGKATPLRRVPNERLGMHCRKGGKADIERGIIGGGGSAWMDRSIKRR